MTLERQEQVSVVQDQGYQRRKRVLEVNPSTRSVFVSRFSAFVWMITIVITLLITFRFALKLIGANAASGFVSFMYGLTDIFVAPFANIIGSPTFGTNSVFDTGSLFAVIIYLLLTWVLLQFFHILFAGTKGTRQVSTFEEVR